MKLETIKVKRFKSALRRRAEKSTGSSQVVSIGANGSGKTTLFDRPLGIP